MLVEKLGLATLLYIDFHRVQLPIPVPEDQVYEVMLYHTYWYFGRNFSARLASWTASLEYEGLAPFALLEGADPNVDLYNIDLQSDMVFTIRSESDYREAYDFFFGSDGEYCNDRGDYNLNFVVAPKSLLS